MTAAKAPGPHKSRTDALADKVFTICDFSWSIFLFVTLQMCANLGLSSVRGFPECLSHAAGLRTLSLGWGPLDAAVCLQPLAALLVHLTRAGLGQAVCCGCPGSFAYCGAHQQKMLAQNLLRGCQVHTCFSRLEASVGGF